METKYRIELIEQFRNGKLIDAIKLEIPWNNMDNCFDKLVEISNGNNDRFRVTAIFPQGQLYYNHFHVFHNGNIIMVFRKHGWEDGNNGQLWVKYEGMNEFIPLSEINDDYEQGLIFGSMVDDFFSEQWFESKLNGKMQKFNVVGRNPYIFSSVSKDI